MHENMIIYDKINFVVGPDKTWYTTVKSRLDGFLLKNKKTFINLKALYLLSLGGDWGGGGHNFPSTIDYDATGVVQPKLTLTRGGGVLSYIAEL